MKTFYSAEDIEALVAQGQIELTLDEDTVLTQLARDTAQRLGLKLIRGSSAAPASSQPGSGGISRGAVTGLGAKPKGCQHGSRPGRPSVPRAPSGSSDRVVNDLVDLVRQLSKGSES